MTDRTTALHWIRNYIDNESLCLCRISLSWQMNVGRRFRSNEFFVVREVLVSKSEEISFLQSLIGATRRRGVIRANTRLRMTCTGRGDSHLSL